MSDRDNRSKEGWEDLAWAPARYNDRTVLKSGSFLNSFCPHCGESLLRDNMIHLDTVTLDGDEGSLDLSPYLNVFERRSDIRLAAGEEVKDLRCWRCRRSLKVEDRFCAHDGSPAARIMIGISTIRVPFYFCMREGCRWHEIDPYDEHQILLDDSMEW